MKRQVLIADHDDASRNVLAKNVASWGYEAVLASDGDEAWAILQRDGAPRVVLIDSDVPGLPALDLCRRLRNHHGNDCLIMYLTAPVGRSAGPLELDALEAGADDVIHTPVHLRELRVRLSAALRGRTLESRAQSPTELTRRNLSEAALVSPIVAGKYQVERLIGRGGMGTVWQGTHIALGTKVAIKFIKSEYAAIPSARARFELEARCAARLATRYAVRVFDYGLTEEGVPYLVMEYLEGASLLQHVQRHGPLSFGETVTFIAQAAHALSQLHASGTIHRDVKPDNILIVDDPDAPAGKPRRIAKLIDFGVAKVLAAQHEERNADCSTQHGVVVGTPNYMPPEMLESIAPATVASDLWALATCAFTAMTGRIPFEGATLAEVMIKVCRTQTPVPSRIRLGVPPEFDRWFARACHPDATKRFQSARELARALNDAHAEHDDALLDLTPSLNKFVSVPPVSRPSRRATVRPEGSRFELDYPTLANG